MISLFETTQGPVSREQYLMAARFNLVSYLNKGVIPIWEEFQKELPEYSDQEIKRSVENNFQKLTKWSFLENILNLEGTEYFFHGPCYCQRLLADGQKENVELRLDEEDWQLWLEIMTIHFRKNWNVENPFVSFYAELFGCKYRLSFIHFSTSPVSTSKLVVRRLAGRPHGLKSFGETDLLEFLIQSKANFIVAGSTGSGKTSLLSSLIHTIDRREHLLILEDTFEISSEHPHQTRMLSGPMEQNSLKAYLTYGLRLSPDRIILGEMRSEEVVTFLLAMNTGHKGLMGTIHASSAADALERVALLFALYSGEARLELDKVMQLLCRNLQYVVYMENKKVKEVIQVLGSEKGVPFFTTDIEFDTPQ